MKWIDYATPGSVQEAVALLAEHGDRARIMAGGTDVLVQLRAGRLGLDLLVDGKNIPELNELSFDGQKGLTLGAAVPCYRIYGNADVKAHYGGIVDATSIIGGVLIQGRASVGGNLCNAAPSADSIPVLIALGATCNIAGSGGTRQLPVEEFCTGPGTNALRSGEMLVSVSVPAPAANSGATYMRFIPRNEMDIAVAGAGVSVLLENGTFKSAKVALSAVAPTPLFVKEAGDALTGQPVNEASIQKAAEIARDAARPITDMRGTIEYRKHLCEVLTRRTLNIAVDRAKEAR